MMSAGFGLISSKGSLLASPRLSRDHALISTQAVVMESW